MQSHGEVFASLTSRPRTQITTLELTRGFASDRRQSLEAITSTVN